MVDDSNTEIHFRWNGNAAYVFQQTLMNAAGVTISAGNFSGAGTNLTGTAANLSVGNSDKLDNRDSTGFMRTFSAPDNIYSQSFSAFASNYGFGAAMLNASDGPIGAH